MEALQQDDQEPSSAGNERGDEMLQGRGYVRSKQSWGDLEGRLEVALIGLPYDGSPRFHRAKSFKACFEPS